MRSKPFEQEMTFSAEALHQYIELYMRAHGFVHDDQDIKIKHMLPGVNNNYHVAWEAKKEERMVSVNLSADRAPQELPRNG